jgi:hypothetical protein
VRGEGAKSHVAVFTDDFVTPFRDSLGCRLLLHVIRPPLDRLEWSALAATAQLAGDQEVFVRGLAGVTEPDTWSLPPARFEAYEEIASSDDTAIWSPQGLWGMFVSVEDYAVFGSSERDITEALAANMPDLPRYSWDDEPQIESDQLTLPSRAQLNEFQRHWTRLNRGAKDSWPDRVIAHVRASADLCS